MAEIKADPAARVVVLTGAGDRAFCAGADLTGMADGAGHLDLHDSRGDMAGLFGELWDLGKPTIARVRGFALAGGMGLALACDLVVAADDAVFGTPEIDVGLWPYMITVPADAVHAAQDGARADDDRSAGAARTRPTRIGFVNRVVPVDRARRRGRRAGHHAGGQVAGRAAPGTPGVLRRVGPVGRRRPARCCTPC